jgi:histidine triad (HIT) family protein
MTCIFCDIIDGKPPSHKVWESETHVAFLSIFPNTKGMTVVIPKQHFKSYAFNMPEEDLLALVKATKEVALLLDRKLGVGRTAMVFEGFGVDHVHAKLFPMHGTPTNPNQAWTPIKSSDVKNNEYFHTYQGYISSHDGKRADDQELAALAEKIRSEP